jgi:hypothetical protein
MKVDLKERGAERPVTASTRYETLSMHRQPYLRRARDCALITIPGIMPPEGHNGSSDLYKPFQSVGADGVNNLASKIALVLFPPGSPFFKLELDDFTVEQLAAQQDMTDADVEDFRAESDEALGKMERAVVTGMEEKGTRAVLFEVFKHLIICGNILVHVLPDGKLKLLPLDRFVVKRDGSGNILDVVVKETMSCFALPEAARRVYDEWSKNAADTEKSDQKNVDIYTWVRRRKGGGYDYHQEICNRIIPETEGFSVEGKDEWLPLRWSHVAGEDYGRSRCDEYIGDLQSLEEVEKAIIIYTAVASKILCLVNESGVTRKQDVEESESGDIIDGDAKDIAFLQVDKHMDFSVVVQRAEEKRGRLERAFMLAASVQREAERVTAEEIRAMIGELEQSLGGVYSVMAEELQRPLVVTIMSKMEKSGKLPTLPKDTVRPKIITGIDGLGRASDFQKLLTLMTTLIEQLGQPAVLQWLNIGAFIQRCAAALGVDITGLLKSPQEVQQEQQQAMMAQMTEKLGPNTINAISKNMQQQPAASAAEGSAQ